MKTPIEQVEESMAMPPYGILDKYAISSLMQSYATQQVSIATSEKEAEIRDLKMNILNMVKDHGSELDRLKSLVPELKKTIEQMIESYTKVGEGGKVAVCKRILHLKLIKDLPQSPKAEKTNTGIKDKNGKDIYDGDILGQDCHMVDDYSGKESIEVLKLIVRWSDKRSLWTVYCPSAPLKDDWNYIPKNCYVIGNITVFNPKPNDRQ